VVKEPALKIMIPYTHIIELLFQFGIFEHVFECILLHWRCTV